MKKFSSLFVIAVAILVFSCSKSSEKRDRSAEKVYSTEQMKSDSISSSLNMSLSKEKEEINTEDAKEESSSNPLSSSAAVENGNNPNRKFIRTADLKFKVKSVIDATYSIEDLINREGGFVTYTNLKSEVDHVSNTALNADSSLETTYFDVSNTMKIRVPNTRLDTTLKQLAKYIDYLDYRIVEAQDVALSMMVNDMTQKRVARNEKRMIEAIDTRGKKLVETTNAEELLMRKQEEADAAKVANLSLSDQISFSTISLYIYQRQSIKREVVSNEKNIKAYQPSLGSRIIDAFMSGWEVIEAIIIFIAQIWGLILFGLIVVFGYRKFASKRKNKSSENV